MSNFDSSTQCDAGIFCIAGASSPSDISDPSISISCPIGFYCEVGTVVPQMCPAGFWSDALGLLSAAECSPCDEGYYCLQGQTEVDLYACPSGFFCPAETANPYITSSTDDKDYVLYCPIGHFCKNGIKEPCENGLYQDKRGQLICKTCPAGYFCPDDALGVFSPSTCTAGNYCEEASATETPCPVGYFATKLGLMSADQCEICLPGKYCDS